MSIRCSLPHLHTLHHPIHNTFSFPHATPPFLLPPNLFDSPSIIHCFAIVHPSTLPSPPIIHSTHPISSFLFRSSWLDDRANVRVLYFPFIPLPVCFLFLVFPLYISPLEILIPNWIKFDLTHHLLLRVHFDLSVVRRCFTPFPS